MSIQFGIIRNIIDGRTRGKEQVPCIVYNGTAFGREEGLMYPITNTEKCYNIEKIMGKNIYLTHQWNLHDGEDLLIIGKVLCDNV